MFYFSFICVQVIRWPLGLFWLISESLIPFLFPLDVLFLILLLFTFHIYALSFITVLFYCLMKKETFLRHTLLMVWFMVYYEFTSVSFLVPLVKFRIIMSKFEQFCKHSPIIVMGMRFLPPSPDATPMRPTVFYMWHLSTVFLCDTSH